MNMFTDKEIKDRLLEADYPNNDVLLSGVLERIRAFGPEASRMFEKWMEDGATPKFDTAGISSDYLRVHHNMKDVALIIAFDWLHKKPEEAARLLKKTVIPYEHP